MLATMGKCSLKTFPFKVVLDDNESLIEAEFGIKGYAVLVKLYQAIYSRGYYMKWDIDTQLLFTRDYCLSEVGRNVVSEIVTSCVRRGVFESTIFEKYQILTSKRIQETFLTATRRNTEVIIDERYALPIVYEFIESANKKGKNVNIILKTDDSLSTVCNKRKENKNKKKIKEDNITPRTREENDEMFDIPISEWTESQKQFYEAFDIQVDNYGVNFRNIDFNLLYSAYLQSLYLQTDTQARYLSWICKHYDKIVGGYYKDRPKPTENTSQSARRSTKQRKSIVEEHADFEAWAREQDLADEELQRALAEEKKQE